MLSLTSYQVTAIEALVEQLVKQAYQPAPRADSNTSPPRADDKIRGPFVRDNRAQV